MQNEAPRRGGSQKISAIRGAVDYALSQDVEGFSSTDLMGELIGSDFNVVSSSAKLKSSKDRLKTSKLSRSKIETSQISRFHFVDERNAAQQN